MGFADDNCLLSPILEDSRVARGAAVLVPDLREYQGLLHALFN
jgi:hypothetical protein